MKIFSWTRLIAIILLVAMLITSESAIIFASEVADVPIPVDTANITAQQETKNGIMQNPEMLRKAYWK